MSSKPEVASDPIEQGFAPELVTVLIEVGQALVANLSTNAVLAAALDVVQRVLSAEASSIFLVDTDSGNLRVYLADPDHQGALKSLVQPKGKGLSGIAVEQGKAILVADAYNDPRFDPTADKKTGFRTRSVLCVPLRVLGENIGVVQVLNKKGGGAFAERELILLQAVASLVALALDNASKHEELLQAQRLATVGETIASLAHCIKNVLSGINAGTFFINDAIGKDNMAGVKKGWEIADSNMKFLSDLVLNMLSFARDRKPALQATDINRLCNEVVKLVSEQAREREVEVAVEPDEKLAKVSLDSVGLRRCLLNLVGNAVDACAEKKGKVTVAVSGSNGKVRIAVQDTGSGISPENLKKLFTVFFSTKGNRGTGLGLPVSKKIIEEHGGKLEVDSQLNKGTTFTIVLPIDNPSE